MGQNGTVRAPEVIRGTIDFFLPTGVEPTMLCVTIPTGALYLVIIRGFSQYGFLLYHRDLKAQCADFGIFFRCTFHSKVVFCTQIWHNSWTWIRIICTCIKVLCSVHRKKNSNFAHWALRLRRCTVISRADVLRESTALNPQRYNRHFTDTLWKSRLFLPSI